MVMCKATVGTKSRLHVLHNKPFKVIAWFVVGLYEVLIDSQCLTYSRSWSAYFGEADRSTDSTEVRLCNAVDRRQKHPPKKINIS